MLIQLPSRRIINTDHVHFVVPKGNEIGRWQMSLGDFGIELDQADYDVLVERGVPRQQLRSVD